MLEFRGRAARLCDGIARRELLQVGGLGLLGLQLPALLQAREAVPLGLPPTDKTFGQAKSIIFLYLAGGPPQHETFDPKPLAPLEIRGPFSPISTTVPGIQYCELLPRTARLAHKLAIIRSLATDDNTHSSSGHWVLTGYKYRGPNPRTIQATDWPYFGSILKRYRPSEALPPLSTVWIPDILRLNESVTPAGQTGGLMGGEWDPDRFVGDPSSAAYQVEGLRMSELPRSQLLRRRQLLGQLDAEFDQGRGSTVQLYGKFQQQAFDLLTSGKAQAAFDIQREPAAVRERYGLNPWGQCVLLARRLVEAGVRLVHVQWPREPGDNAVDNPLWDTHAQNADRVEDVLCPQFDVGFSALIEDLEQRGLLDETLVVAVGEFGRTPKINAKGGRDHWGPVFSCALAGAGISGGQVYGASDKQGGYPVQDRAEPGDLTATMFHLAGLDYRTTFRDLEGREHRLTEGQPLFKLLGLQPATDERVSPGGSLARVPPYDPTRLLASTGFGEPLLPLTAPSRPKGWRAGPLLEARETRSPEANTPEANTAGGLAARRDGERVRLGLLAGGGPSPRLVPAQATAVLAQEVRSPFAGTYRLTAHLHREATAEAFGLLKQHCAARLVLFQYTAAGKPASERKELAAQVLDWDQLGREPAPVVLEQSLLNPNPGQNFSFGLGLGVALIVEKVSDGDLPIPASRDQEAVLVVSRMELEFTGKPRNEKVKV